MKSAETIFDSWGGVTLGDGGGGCVEGVGGIEQDVGG